MLPKSSRLTSKEIETLSFGKNTHGTLISMRFKPSLVTKFSIAASKKIFPRAFDRNKIRRKTYDLLRPFIKKITNPSFIMLLPKKEFLDAPMDTIENDIKNVFEKAGLIR